MYAPKEHTETVGSKAEALCGSGEDVTVERTYADAERPLDEVVVKPTITKKNLGILASQFFRTTIVTLLLHYCRNTIVT